MGLSPETLIKAICPELSGSPSLRVYLGMAVEVTSRGFFGALYNQAVAYRACHLFTVMSIGNGSSTMDAVKEISGGAPITSMHEGGIAVTFAQNNGSNEAMDLESTRFGRMLLGLMRSRPTMNVAAWNG